MSNRAALKSPVKKIQVVMLLILGLVSVLPAQASDREGHFRSGVNIKNFGKVDENLYRGAQPKGEDFRALAALGVKTVINLRNDNVGEEAAQARAAGLRYISIPIEDKNPPSAAQNLQFLETMKDTANGPYYVHCAGGRHRTGVMVATYRMTHYNWDIDRAYREMKDYDFYTRWGHGDMKDYVYSYYKQMRRSPVTQQAKTNNGITQEKAVDSTVDNTTEQSAPATTGGN